MQKLIIAFCLSILFNSFAFAYTQKNYSEYPGDFFAIPHLYDFCFTTQSLHLSVDRHIIYAFTYAHGPSEKKISSRTPTSAELLKQAWDAYNAGNMSQAFSWAQQLTDLYNAEAQAQQNNLTGFPNPTDPDFYQKTWALNDVACGYFIMALVSYKQGLFTQAKGFNDLIISKYSYAQAPDGSSWWKVRDAAKKLNFAMENGIEYEKISSQTLLAKVWKYYKAKDWAHTKIWAQGVIDFYNDIALAQQSKLTGFPKPGSADFYQKTWALNDVACAYYTLAVAYSKQGDKETARRLAQYIIDKLYYAQAKGSSGWWKVKTAAQKLLKEIGNREQVTHKSEHCPPHKNSSLYQNISRKSTYSDRTPTSAELLKQAWDAYNAGNMSQAFSWAQQLTDLYNAEAQAQQNNLTGFPNPTDPDFYQKTWALNDVACGYFIMALVSYKQGLFTQAKGFNDLIISKYSYAQAPDGSSWWKVRDAAKKLNFAMENGIAYEKISSQTLMTRAWEYYAKNDWKNTKTWAQGVIDFYQDIALTQQSKLTSLPNPTSPDFYQKTWALNDVATAYYVLAVAYSKQGDKETARRLAQYIIDKLYYAQAKGSSGWWKVKDAAQKLLKDIGYTREQFAHDPEHRPQNTDPSCSPKKKESPISEEEQRVKAYFYQIRRAQQEGDTAKASELLQTIIRHFANVRVYDPLTKQYVRAGDLASQQRTGLASKTSAKNETLGEKTSLQHTAYRINTLSMHAHQAYLQGNYLKALTYARQAIRLAPSAQSTKHSSEEEKKIKEEITKDIARCYVIIAQTSMHLRQYTTAEKTFTLLKQHYPHLSIYNEYFKLVKIGPFAEQGIQCAKAWAQSRNPQVKYFELYDRIIGKEKLKE